MLRKALSLSLDKAAEGAWRQATRDELLEVARRMVEIDREKALAASAILAWACSGREPELQGVKPGDLAWLFQADREQVRAFAGELARIAPDVAGWLWVELGYAQDERDQRLSQRIREGQ